MDAEKLKNRLSEFEIQPSAPRLAIAQYVLNTQNHPTAEEVKAEVETRIPSISMATIYNTLNLFVERGLLRSLPDPGQQKTRYDSNTQPHYHFYDEDSGQLVDLDPSLLRLKPNFDSLQESYQISSVEVMVRGKRKPKSQKGEIQ